MNYTNSFIQPNLISRIFIIIMVVMSGLLRLSAQNCYVRLFDASGIEPTQAQLDSLENAACRLRDSLPEAFRESFKVYDFGFYLHNENMVGGYPEMFQAAITQAQSQSEYYLLFGKQTDKNGIYTKFWVALKLPDQDIFSCIDLLSPTLRSDLTKKYGIIANTVHTANEKAYFRYHLAEIKTIESLRSYVTSLKECCLPPGQQRRGPSCTSCAFSAAEFGQNLLNSGFYALENQLITGEITSTEISENVVGRTNLIVEIEGDSIEIDKQINGISERYLLNNPGKTIKIYLNRYDDLCGNFEPVYEDFLNNGSDAKVFVVAILYPLNQVKLYFDYLGELSVNETSAIGFVKGLPDHYFDLDGTYLGQDEGGWSRIRVINDTLSADQINLLYKNKANKLIKKSVGEPISVDLSTHVAFIYGQGRDPNTMFSKIGEYYASQLGIYKPVVLNEKAGVTAIAWCNSPAWDKINVNKNPFSTLMDNYNQFTNVIFHESMHIITQKGSEQFPCDHAKFIYLEQLKHASFSKCSYEYKTGMIGSITCYLVKCWGDSEFAGGGFTNVSNMVNELNSEIKKYGLRLTMKNNGPAGFECNLNILKTNASSPINCSDYEKF